MQLVRYKVFFDGQSAKQADLDRIDTITVTQTMDQLWEASIELLICASVKGGWDPLEKFAEPLRRVRIEIKVGNGSFVPLIDGPVAATDPQLHSEPGRSQRIIRVYDDSVYLGRKDNLDAITGDDDSAIARKIFDQVNEIKDKQIDRVPAGPADRTSALQPRGTLMEALHTLARRHPKMHAWVKPGKQAGQSIGMFKAEESSASGDFPALVLFGDKRNIDSFNVSQNALRPARVAGAFLNLKDKTWSTKNKGYGDVLDGGKAVIKDGDTGLVLLPPGYAIGVDPEEALQSVAANLAVVYEADASVRNFCYAGVLEPYRRVTVKAVGDKLSGDWLIESVTHTITRSEYSQSFHLQRRDESQSFASAPLSEIVA